MQVAGWSSFLASIALPQLEDWLIKLGMASESESTCSTIGWSYLASNQISSLCCTQYVWFLSGTWFPRFFRVHSTSFPVWNSSGTGRSQIKSSYEKAVESIHEPLWVPSLGCHGWPWMFSHLKNNFHRRRSPLETRFWHLFTGKNNSLDGGWATPLKNMKVGLDHHLNYWGK